jgi:signal transduction histidine kinase
VLRELRSLKLKLGLAIARWIAELHGGEIHAERREPAGTRFVTLPQAV